MLTITDGTMRLRVRVWGCPVSLPGECPHPQEGSEPMRRIAMVLVTLVVATTASAEAQEVCDDWPSRQFFETADSVAVARCLDRGESVEARNDNRETPLHLAAAYSAQPSVIMVLLDRVADDAQALRALANEDDRTPLHYAARRGSPEVVSALIKAGANLLARNTRGRTPLHLAAMHDKLDQAKVIVNTDECDKACVNARTNDDRTPLHDAAASSTPMPEMVKFLIVEGARLDVHDSDGLTPKLLAKHPGVKELIEEAENRIPWWKNPAWVGIAVGVVLGPLGALLGTLRERRMSRRLQKDGR